MKQAYSALVTGHLPMEKAGRLTRVGGLFEIKSLAGHPALLPILYFPAGTSTICGRITRTPFSFLRLEARVASAA